MSLFGYNNYKIITTCAKEAVVCGQVYYVNLAVSAMKKEF